MGDTMSRRDQIAMAAMAGLLAMTDDALNEHKAVAAEAVKFADALIARLDGFARVCNAAVSQSDLEAIHAALKRSEELQSEIARLKAELAKYTEPLTDDEAAIRGAI